jgi:hypothetical protein
LPFSKLDNVDLGFSGADYHFPKIRATLVM